MFKGIGASPGIAVGPALVYAKPDLEIPTKSVGPDEVTKELQRFGRGVGESRAQLNSIRVRTEAQLGQEQGAIFQAQLMILEDPILIGEITSLIKEELNPAELAVKKVSDRYIELLRGAEDQYVGERWADVADVGRRLIQNLLGIRRFPLADMTEEAIIVSTDLSPSDTAQLPRDKALAFVTEHGGRTSHSAIMARSLDIPAVVGTGNILSRVKNGDTLVVDGDRGLVLINPDILTLDRYRKKLALWKKSQHDFGHLKKLPATTIDGYSIKLGANIGTPEEVDLGLAYGAELIGLYRTEYLYFGRPDMPSEEEQVEVYRQVISRMAGKPVVIRTLDIGGDKPLANLTNSGEINPFLGWRGIRLSLDRKDIFKTQLRAILRASEAGPIRVMFPLVISAQEIKEAKEVFYQAKAELTAQGIGYSKNIELGIMIETPGAAVISDLLVDEVDFFSIGTNDLVQYTLAVDRTNEQVSHLYDHYHPAVLRLIYQVVRAARKHDKKVSICGEMAGDTTAVPLLLGLGLEELSMSPGAILRVKQVIRSVAISEMKQLAQQILTLGDPSEVRQVLQEIIIPVS